MKEGNLLNEINGCLILKEEIFLLQRYDVRVSEHYDTN